MRILLVLIAAILAFSDQAASLHFGHEKMERLCCLTLVLLKE